MAYLFSHLAMSALFFVSTDFISSTYSYKDASNKKVEKDAFAVLKYSDSSLELVGIG